MTIHDRCRIEEHLFPDREKMTGDLLRDVGSRLAHGIATRGRASLVAAGGTTPGDFYLGLRDADLDWARIELTLSDDRWLSPRENGSNETRIRDGLLRGRARAACWRPLRSEDGAELDGIAAMPRPFDVTLLGMGVDGHTASLLPHAEGLAEALDTRRPALVRAIKPRDPVEMGERLSLTLRAILDSQIVMLLIQGEEKLRAYRDALAGDDVLAMPVRALFQQSSTPVQVFWAP